MPDPIIAPLSGTSRHRAWDELAKLQAQVAAIQLPGKHAPPAVAPTSPPAPSAPLSPATVRRRSARGDAPEGWVFLSDAAQRYRVSRSSLHQWCLELAPHERHKSPDSGQVRVLVTALEVILRSHGR